MESQQYYSVAETNQADATSFYTYIPFASYNQITIRTGTLTASTVVVEATVKEAEDAWFDVTNDLFTVASLSASTAYTRVDSPAYKSIRIKHTTTNATNATNFDVMVRKTRG